MTRACPLRISLRILRQSFRWLVLPCRTTRLQYHLRRVHSRRGLAYTYPSKQIISSSRRCTRGSSRPYDGMTPSACCDQWERCSYRDMATRRRRSAAVGRPRVPRCRPSGDWSAAGAAPSSQPVTHTTWSWRNCIPGGRDGPTYDCCYGSSTSPSHDLKKKFSSTMMFFSKWLVFSPFSGPLYVPIARTPTPAAWHMAPHCLVLLRPIAATAALPPLLPPPFASEL